MNLLARIDAYTSAATGSPVVTVVLSSLFRLDAMVGGDIWGICCEG